MRRVAGASDGSRHSLSTGDEMRILAMSNITAAGERRRRGEQFDIVTEDLSLKELAQLESAIQSGNARRLVEDGALVMNTEEAAPLVVTKRLAKRGKK